MDCHFIYITCADEEEAQKISAFLVENRLAACANIFPAHHSIYWWNDKIQHGKEVAVILKTRTDLFEKLKLAVCSLHSYECPCIVAMPIEKGHKSFLEWVKAQTNTGVL